MYVIIVTVPSGGVGGWGGVYSRETISRVIINHNAVSPRMVMVIAGGHSTSKVFKI